MTVETTLQKMFDECPTLFCTRKDCYNHLFCTIGTGYEWKRGQLIYYDGNEDDIEAEEADYSTEHPTAKQSEEHIQEMEDCRRRLLSISPRFKEDIERWYPICEYSNINNIPDDIRPDWKAAVEECKEMLRKDGVVL